MLGNQTSTFEIHYHVLTILTVVYGSEYPIPLETIMRQANLPLSKYQMIQFVDVLAASRYIKKRTFDSSVTYWSLYSSGPCPPMMFSPYV